MSSGTVAWCNRQLNSRWHCGLEEACVPIPKGEEVRMTAEEGKMGVMTGSIEEVTMREEVTVREERTVREEKVTVNKEDVIVTGDTEGRGVICRRGC